MIKCVKFLDKVFEMKPIFPPRCEHCRDDLQCDFFHYCVTSENEAPRYNTQPSLAGWLQIITAAFHSISEVIALRGAKTCRDAMVL